LMWLRFAHGQRWENGTVAGNAEKVSWHEAMKIPITCSYGKYNDWRVATIDELRTLIDKVKGTKRNFIDADVFPKNEKWFWSSSPKNEKWFWSSSPYAEYIGFDGGYSSSDGKDASNCVRLVRG